MKGMLEHLALSRVVPALQKRVKTLCYEDMLSEEKDKATIEAAIEHWYGSLDDVPKYNGTLPGHKEYHGSHSTVKDDELQERLLNLAKKIDREHYNGEIAWFDSFSPC